MVARQVEWFWEVLAEASADTRLRILTWTTGLARAPLGKFVCAWHAAKQGGGGRVVIPAG